MIDRDEETYCLTLRAVRPWTADVLYEAKTLTGEPIYRWVDRMVAYYVEHHPSMLEMRLEEVRLLAAEYGANDGTALIQS